MSPSAWKSLSSWEKHMGKLRVSWTRKVFPGSIFASWLTWRTILMSYGKTRKGRRR
uniref:Uncharacterized protein n=1 Tax=Rousettus aegyptiacus TaxID=9407 RepID=A0A7J8F1E9_ROUAE|nr:hypothetical protein HJG63_012281 [Rousettus aegyptiacus]